MMNYRTGNWNIGGTMEDLLLAGKGSCFLVLSMGLIQILSLCLQMNGNTSVRFAMTGIIFYGWISTISAYVILLTMTKSACKRF